MNEELWQKHRAGRVKDAFNLVETDGKEITANLMKSVSICKIGPGPWMPSENT